MTKRSIGAALTATALLAIGYGAGYATATHTASAPTAIQATPASAGPSNA